MKTVKFILVVLIVSMSACKQNDEFADLKQYIDDVHREIQPQKAELPAFNLHEPQQYQATNLRNPFESPKTEVAVLKSKHPLEQVALSKLQLKGIISKAHKDWAVIQIPGGPTLEVSLGTKIGSNHGIITSISRHEIKVRESLVANGKKTHRDVVMKVLKEL